MAKYFKIQHKDVSGDTWTTWSGDTDAETLLIEFVNAVSHEEIDDVNLFWRVEITEGE